MSCGARGVRGRPYRAWVLVRLAPRLAGVGLVGLERELSELLGRPVDVVPASSLKASIEPRLLAEAIPL